MALLPLTACATTIRPPLDPVDPVEVYLVDLGRTPSLVLPTGERAMTRWAYGDWRWYAPHANSNHMAARWLRELGCRVGWPTWSSWRVRAGAADRSAAEVRGNHSARGRATGSTLGAHHAGR